MVFRVHAWASPIKKNKIRIMKNYMTKTSRLTPVCFKNFIALIVAVMFTALFIAGCKGGNADRNGVDSAMSVNDQKIDDSVTAVGTNEADFMVKAANGGMTEVQAAQVAQQKATNDDVKKFATKMVEDHSKLNDQLKSLAGKLNITIPSAIDGDSKAMIDKLNNTKSVDFNKTFMDMMVDAHDKDVDMFQKASGDVANPDVHNFITSALPTLQSHQQMAKKIQASLK